MARRQVDIALIAELYVNEDITLEEFEEAVKFEKAGSFAALERQRYQAAWMRRKRQKAKEEAGHE